ncbi:MAG: LytTR family transcriptional regulator, partial [Porphyrobacter sp.]|nr:LytTR family transcriptional regulator [Porphyrobacter sp.]
ALPRWGVLAAAILVGTVPMTFAVLAVNSLPLGELRWPSFEVLAGTYFSVMVIGGAVTVLFNLVQGRGASTGAGAGAQVASPAAAPEPEPMSPQPPAPAPSLALAANPLLDQLPAEIGSAIIALEMEDHYVRVHTMLGSALVLMRMRDAVALLGDLEGMQVHRSWWVARGAVEDVLREAEAHVTPLAQHILHRAACDPPAAVHLHPLEIAEQRHRIAHPHQHQRRSQHRVDADIVVLHLERDDCAADFGGELIEERICSQSEGWRGRWRLRRHGLRFRSSGGRCDLRTCACTCARAPALHKIEQHRHRPADHHH